MRASKPKKKLTRLHARKPRRRKLSPEQQRALARLQKRMSADPRKIGERSWEQRGFDDRPGVPELLAAIHKALPRLTKLLDHYSSHWPYEDVVYRFYHGSFKVYGVQDSTLTIVRALRRLAPKRPLNAWFMQLVKRGTRRKFKLEHNQRWIEETAPMLEAFFHARYFLEMVVRYGQELKQPPQLLPSGWASVLYLYGLR